MDNNDLKSIPEASVKAAAIACVVVLLVLVLLGIAVVVTVIYVVRHKIKTNNAKYFDKGANTSTRRFSENGGWGPWGKYLTIM